MPELNEQTRLKIEGKSDRIRVRQLVTIDATFDDERLEGGRIYFVNTQKLGTEKLLTRKGDERQFSIWETLTNTARTAHGRFYVVIDEAHRGMRGGRGGRKGANNPAAVPTGQRGRRTVPHAAGHRCLGHTPTVRGAAVGHHAHRAQGLCRGGRRAAIGTAEGPHPDPLPGERRAGGNDARRRGGEALADHGAELVRVLSRRG